MENQRHIFILFEEEDKRLLEKISAHDEEALLRLYDRYTPLIYSFLMRMLRSVEDAESIIHDTFVELWNNWNRFMAGGAGQNEPFYELLLKTVRHKANSSERLKNLKRQVQQPGSQILPVYSEHVLTELPDLLIDKETLQKLIIICRQLSEEEQQVLALAFYEGWTQSEIAKRLSIPAWTVNWSLRKTLNSVASVVGDEPLRGDETHPKKYSEACAALVVGILSQPDLNDLDEHRSAGCAECDLEILRLRSALVLLPFGLPQIVASPELKDRIQFAIQLSEVVKATNTGKEMAPDHGTPDGKGEIVKMEPEAEVVKVKKDKPVRWAKSLLPIFLILSFALNLYLLSGRSLNTRVSDTGSSITAMQKVIDRQNALLGVLEKDKIDIVILKSALKLEDAAGKLLIDPDSRSAILQVSMKNPNGLGPDYSFWIIAGSQKIKIGNFKLGDDPGDERLFRLQLPADVGIRNIKEFLVISGNENSQADFDGKILLRGKPGL